MSTDQVDSNYYDLCRLCACKIKEFGLHIFQIDSTSKDIIKKIYSCLSLQVSEDDGLPKMVCNECVFRLNEMHSFQTKCWKTAQLLLDMIKQEALSHCESLLGVQDDLNGIERENFEVSEQEYELTEHGIQHSTLESHSQQSSLLQPLDVDIIVDDIGMSDICQIDVNQSIALQHQNLELLREHNIQELHNKAIVDPNEQQTSEFLEHKTKIVSQQTNVMPMTKKNEHSGLKKVEKCTHLENKFDRCTYRETIVSDSEIELSDAETAITTDNETSNTDETGPHLIQTPLYCCRQCGNSQQDVDSHIDHCHHLSDEQTDSGMCKCSICGEVFLNSALYRQHSLKMHSDNIQQNQEVILKTELSVKQECLRSDPECSDWDEDDNPAIKEEKVVERHENNDFDDEKDEEVENEQNGEYKPHLTLINDNNTKSKKSKPKVCKDCGKSYRTNYKLTEHMRKHTGDKPYKCATCDKAFRSKIGLAQHEAKHTGQYDFACSICGKGFQCKSYLIVHQRVHSDLKPYTCSTCGRNFKTKQSMLDHTNRHLGVKPYLCETCGRGFITKGLCKSHQRVHSGMDNRQYPCDICQKMFVSKSYLVTHLRIHTGEKPFMCEVCGKGFLTRVDLRIHLTMHTGEKSFVCEMCGKAFARRDALRCHRRSHTGERPYRCDVCGQSFTQFSPMAIHKRLHTGERPYGCDVCKKSFVSRSTMMSHRKKHNPNAT